MKKKKNNETGKITMEVTYTENDTPFEVNLDYNNINAATMTVMGLYLLEEAGKMCDARISDMVANSTYYAKNLGKKLWNLK